MPHVIQSTRIFWFTGNYGAFEHFCVHTRSLIFFVRLFFYSKRNEMRAYCSEVADNNDLHGIYTENPFESIPVSLELLLLFGMHDASLCVQRAQNVGEAALPSGSTASTTTQQNKCVLIVCTIRICIFWFCVFGGGFDAFSSFLKSVVVFGVCKHARAMISPRRISEHTYAV